MCSEQANIDGKRRAKQKRFLHDFFKGAVSYFGLLVKGLLTDLLNAVFVLVDELASERETRVSPDSDMP